MGGCERCQNFCWRLFWQVFIKEMGSSGKVSRSGSLAGKGNFGEELPHKSIVNNRKTTGPPFSAKLNFSHFETLVLVRCHLKVKHVLYIHEHTESEQSRCFVTWHLLGESWTQIVSGCFQDTRLDQDSLLVIHVCWCLKDQLCVRVRRWYKSPPIRRKNTRKNRCNNTLIFSHIFTYWHFHAHRIACVKANLCVLATAPTGVLTAGTGGQHR